MAYTETLTASQVLSNEITKTRKALNVIGGFFAGFGQSMVKASVARHRFETVQRLQGKSDAELARLNLKRDEIVHHVFKDLYYS